MISKNNKTIRAFIKHNKKNFPKKKNFENSNSEVLVEFNAFYPSHLIFSYMSNVLANRNHSKITAFFNYSILASPLKPSFLNRIKWYIGILFSVNFFEIYRSFGVDKFFRPTILKKHEKNAINGYNDIIRKIKCKNDVVNIRIDEIQIGDLIYDTYVKSFSKPTLSIEDEKFKKFLYEFLCLYFFWKEYFDHHEIDAVIGVHTSYSYALPLRIAIKKKIPTYALSTKNITKLDNHIKYAIGNFFEYRKIFDKLDDKLKEKGVLLAKQKLEVRIKGATGVKADLAGTEVSAFHNHKKKSIIKPSQNIKVLVCPHDFFDAPHVFGDTLFADYYDWMYFLGEMSKKTNYDWYIKNRPNHTISMSKFKLYQPRVDETIRKFVQKYNNVKLLPNDYSHIQILEEGINFVLTAYGSVGVEYPLFNIPVINASVNNPHIVYNFNMHPKTVNEYENIVKNLEKVKLEISKKEIYEYYFMRHIFHDKNWLFDDVNEMMDFVGGFDGQYTAKLFEYWVNKFNISRHKRIIKSLNRFLDSNDNLINIFHTQKEDLAFK